MRNLFKSFKEVKNSEEVLSPVEEFFQELNRAYREGQPCLEYSVDNLPEQDFRAICRCLIHHHGLSIDLKVRRSGPRGQMSETLVVDFLKVYVAKNQGFSFVETDKSKELFSAMTRKIGNPQVKNETVPTDSNVIHVDFSNRAKKG